MTNTRPYALEEESLAPPQLKEPEHQAYATDIPDPPTALGALNAQARSEFWASLGLVHTKGLGPRSLKRLLETFGSAFGAVQAAKRWGEAGIREDVARAFLSDAWRQPARKEWNAVRSLHGTVLLWTDSRYPALLRELPDAPVRLYCRGDLSLLGNPCVAIVGTRTCTREGIRAAQAIASGLAASGITIVSGLASGIDRQAHLAAVSLPGSTVAVLGAGPDISYPKENNDLRQTIIKKGLLISEYAPGTMPDPRHFPVRTRIISGLSLGVVVVEAALRSGSLITARLALEQNRAVYAVPGSIGSRFAEGCQKLIRDGALSAFSCADIIADLSPQLQHTHSLASTPARTPTRKDSSPAAAPATIAHTPVACRSDTPCPAVPGSLEDRILTHIAAKQGCDIDALCQTLGADAGAVSAALIIMEVRGCIRQRPDLTYSLI